MTGARGDFVLPSAGRPLPLGVGCDVGMARDGDGGLRLPICEPWWPPEPLTGVQASLRRFAAWTPFAWVLRRPVGHTWAAGGSEVWHGWLGGRVTHVSRAVNRSASGHLTHLLHGWHPAEGVKVAQRRRRRAALTPGGHPGWWSGGASVPPSLSRAWRRSEGA